MTFVSKRWVRQAELVKMHPQLYFISTALLVICIQVNDQKQKLYQKVS
jgi:hypothetical protein